MDLQPPIEVNIPEGKKEIGLAVVNDWHWGSPQCDQQAVKNWVKMIKEKKWYWIGLGDLMENALISSVGDVYQQLMSPQDQADEVIEMLRPIAGRCIGMVSGNHGRRTWKITGMDPDMVIAHQAGIQYRPYTLYALIRLSTSGVTTHWRIMAHHTVGGGRTSGGKLNALCRMSEVSPACDLYLGGHSHSPASDEDRIITMEVPAGAGRGRPVMRYLHRRFSSCGSTLDYAGSYGEARLMRPAMMCQVVHFLGAKRRHKRDASLPDAYFKPYGRRVVVEL